MKSTISGRNFTGPRRPRRSSSNPADLHIIKGAVPTAQPAAMLGHEATGVVTEAGNSVQNVKVGERTIAACVSGCGYCRFCTAGM